MDEGNTCANVRGSIPDERRGCFVFCAEPCVLFVLDFNDPLVLYIQHWAVSIAF